MDAGFVRPQQLLLHLARQATEAYVRAGAIIRPPDPLAPELGRPGALFVCLKIAGELRGCVGTIYPRCPTIAQEAIANAIHAATRDPRFRPVRSAELPLLSYALDVIQPPEVVTDLRDLDPQRYGVIVTAGSRCGLLLPALEGVTDAATQVSLAKQKAGIRPGEPVHLQRFTVERLYESAP